MKPFSLLFLAAFCLLAISYAVKAQPATKTQVNEQPVASAKDAAADKAAKDAEAARVLRERRANAQSLLISLAADAGKFNDQTLRARTQARIADALWEADLDRARSMFRAAWDAAEVADKESQQRVREEVERQRAKNGSVAISGPPNVRGEVLRLAAKRDHALGEEFLAKLKIEKQQEATEASDRNRSNLFNSPEAMSQRLSLARQLLDTDVGRALEFADPALGTITMEGLNFLSYLREKDAAAADRRYGAMLAGAGGSLQSDANTVSLLSSYLFTPHLFVTFEAGGASTSQMTPNIAPPDVSPDLRLAFFNVATQILMRPQSPPEQDQSSSKIQGKYMVMKRLLPLFERFAPREATDAVRAQMDAIATGLPDDLRQRDDDALRQGIREPQSADDREKALLDRIDHAKTSDERDRLYLQLARLLAEKDDPKTRHYVDKIEDTDLRNNARAFIDATMTMRAVDKRNVDRILELVRTGELTHFQKAWALTQASKLLVKTDRDKALTVLDDATTEAKRIEPSDPDRPRALMAVTNVLLLTDRAKAWEAVTDAVKAANSAEGFTGEDGAMRISLLTKTMSSIRTSSSGEFDVSGVFVELARDDYNRTVELARLFEREPPRASAVIAIARSVLEEKKK